MLHGSRAASLILLIISCVLVELCRETAAATLNRICPQPANDCNEVKCQMSYLALKLSQSILPGCVKNDPVACEAEVERVASALELREKCDISPPYDLDEGARQRRQLEHNINSPSPSENYILYVSPSGSNDNAGNTRQAALRTVQAALERYRSMNLGNRRRTIMLLAGKYRLTAPIELTTMDSYTTIRGEPGAILTGAVSLSNIRWAKVSDNAFEAILPSDIATSLGPLSVLSHSTEAYEFMRAQHPNKASWLDTTFERADSIRKWFSSTPKVPFVDRIRVPVDTSPTRRRYRHFSRSSNGTCVGVFHPPIGYFCDQNPDGDGGCIYSTPVAVDFASKGINLLRFDGWRDKSTAYFHVLHTLKWGGWSFAVNSTCSIGEATTLCFERGGFQEARGDCGQGGGDWYIENVPELLDHPGEFFFDFKTSTIRFIPYMPLDDASEKNLLVNLEIGTTVQRLISTKISPNAPEHQRLRGVRISNIVFEKSYPTHMERHETPSGGDWAVHRGGALFIENAEDITVTDCTFRLLGSNGLFLSNSVHGARILRNNFFGLDGSGILLVGDPKYEADQPWDRRQDTDYISDVLIRNNIISDVGLRELQGAPIFGSISKNIRIENNVVFNGPRAGIVYNDIFGGNLQTIGNVMFNLVRVTHDHGPYNVWDRQRWFLPSNDESNSNLVEGNFILGNDYGPKLVDLDDGARNHIIRRNVLAFGFMKIKGFNQTGENNVIVAYLSEQKSCVDVVQSDTTDPRYTWHANTCFSPNSKLPPFNMIGVNYCTGHDLSVARNVYKGISTSARINRCGSMRSWLKSHKQDVGSIFISKLPKPHEIFRECEATVSPYFQG